MTKAEEQAYGARPYAGGLVSPSDALAFCWRHKGKILLTLALVVAVVMTVAIRSPKKFEANAKLLNRPGRETLALDPSIVGPTLDVSQSRESEINSELAILQSRALAEQVVDQLGPERLLRPSDRANQSVPGVNNDHPGLLVRLGFVASLPPREQAIEKFMKSLTIEVEGKSNIINAGFRATNPTVARDALDRLIQAYLERHIALYSLQAPLKYFDEQRQLARQALQQKEDDLRAFCSAQGIIDLDRQKGELLERVDRLANDLAEVDGQIAASRARSGALSRSLAKHEERMELSRVVGKANNASDLLKTKLAELREKEADLAARYPDDARPLISVREQIKRTEAALGREHETLTEVTTGVDTNYQALQLSLENEQAQLRALDARREIISAELERQKKGLNALAGHETTLARLQREKKMAEGVFEKSNESYQRAQDYTALDRGKVASISIVQPASVSLKPVSPRLPMLFVLSLILGTVCGLSLALCAESFRRNPAMGGVGYQDEAVAVAPIPGELARNEDVLAPTALMKP